MSEIRAFRVAYPQERLDDLRRRVLETRWPTSELVADRSQGVQSATMHALADYWVTEYDWSACEARLNALPQFTTGIDGVDIHFIHVRSPHENALPLIMTHGWPGSVIELLETVGPLTDPTAHGGTPEDAFHLVLPSLPGYGFSSEPTELGWDSAPHGTRVGGTHAPTGLSRATSPRAETSDALVTDLMGRQSVEGLAGLSPEPAHRCPRDRRSPAQGDRAGTRRPPPPSRCSVKTDSATSSRWRRVRRRSAYSLARFADRPGGLVARSRHRQLLQGISRPSSTANPWATSRATTCSTTSRSTG